jgi:natural product precursor
MKKIKQLRLSKEVIASLDNNDMSMIQGGDFTAGCTDGCSLFFATAWHCTKADCTADCNTNTIVVTSKASCNGLAVNPGSPNGGVNINVTGKLDINWKNDSAVVKKYNLL